MECEPHKPGMNRRCVSLPRGLCVSFWGAPAHPQSPERPGAGRKSCSGNVCWTKNTQEVGSGLPWCQKLLKPCLLVGFPTTIKMVLLTLIQSIAPPGPRRGWAQCCPGSPESAVTQSPVSNSAHTSWKPVNTHQSLPGCPLTPDPRKTSAPVLPQGSALQVLPLGKSLAPRSQGL